MRPDRIDCPTRVELMGTARPSLQNLSLDGDDLARCRLVLRPDNHPVAILHLLHLHQVRAIVIGAIEAELADDGVVEDSPPEEPEAEMTADLFAGDTDEENDGEDVAFDEPPPPSAAASSSAGPEPARPAVSQPSWRSMRFQDRILALRLLHGRGPR